ncbi:MAG: hypothetical protein ACOWW1_10240 [archaeon]
MKTGTYQENLQINKTLSLIGENVNTTIIYVDFSTITEKAFD